MSNVILHQYADSPFSEKVRALLGYKNASYRMVEIPPIMPRPFVIPLTGGYRRTPVMQAGADIYCDTALICRVIDQMYPDNTIYPAQSVAGDAILANWIDTFLFRCAVALVFQPKALVGNSLMKDEETAAAFMADRAEFSKGSTQLQMDIGIAESHFQLFLNDFDKQLASADFFGGSSPSIVDFSAYHITWFVRRSAALQGMFEPFANVLNWYDRMHSFGHGDYEMIEGQVALDDAAAVEPIGTKSDNVIEDLTPGQEVEVMPIDYGFQPVRGSLMAADLDVIAVARTDEQVGPVVVHFPRMGFQVTG